MRRLVSGLIVVLLLRSMLMLMSNVQPVKSEWTGTVYIRADGSIDPPDAPITTYDNITYFLIDNLVCSEHGIVVQRGKVIIDGADHTIQGPYVVPVYDLPEELQYIGVNIFGCDNVTIRNLKIENFYIGIRLWGSYNCNITEVILANNHHYGVFISGERNFIVKNNVTGSNFGVDIDGNYNVIAKNHIIDNNRGIFLTGHINNVTKNYIENNRHGGIHLHMSQYNVISDNIFVNDGLYVSDSYDNVVVNNTVNGKPLTYLENVSNVTIGNSGQVILVNCDVISIENLTLSFTYTGIELLNTHNTIIFGNHIANCKKGIELLRCLNNTITANNITNNEDFGLYLTGSNYNNISQNVFIGDGLHIHYSYNNVVVNNTVNDRPLIYLEGASDVTVEDAGQVILVRCNNIRIENLNLCHTSVGIELLDTSATSIYENDLINNTYGVSIVGSSWGNNVSNNNVVANYIGIRALDTQAYWQTISNNVITNNYVGIFFHMSDGNLIYGNSLLNNVYGVVILSCWCNTFYHNNFVNNTQQVYCVQYENAFDNGYPAGGNYWSDYNGTDSDGDGMGDVPYILNEGNVDHYPLIGPWTIEGSNISVIPLEELNVTFENVTSPGITTATKLYTGPEPPSGFKLAGNYYDIKTTASYTGNIKIKIIYDSSNMTEEEENNLRLMQWDEILQQWIDITTFLDTENNVIYGEAFHISIFTIITPLYAPPTTYTLTITTTAGGTTNPAPGAYTYTAGSSVQVAAIPSSGYLFDHWELNGTNLGSSNPYTVFIDNNYILKAFFVPAPQPLTVSINPTSASILVSQSVTFTSTVSGGTPPYNYQWYLNDNPVLGATSPTWTFTSTTSGIFYIYLEVTDSKGNTAQSNTARIIVSTVPVGGHSIPINIKTNIEPTIPYIALIAILTISFTTLKRKNRNK